MLIDQFMPHWDVRERHEIRVHAPPERVCAALRTADLAYYPLVRLLLGLRALPAVLTKGAVGVRELLHQTHEPITLSAFERRGFTVLRENPPHELVIGLEGAFWRPRGDVRAVTEATFRQPVADGLARATWNFTVVPVGGGCRLVTETRVLPGPRAWVPFRLYWLVVRPASGLIRHLMLRSIRRTARDSPGPRTTPTDTA